MDLVKSPPNLIAWSIILLTSIAVPILELFGRTIYRWTQAVILLSVLALWILWHFLLRPRISSPRQRWFEPIDFGQPKEQTLRDAAEGILSTHRAEASYVHAAPQDPQLPDILKKLTHPGLARIGGKPGCGKSLLAYQAAYNLQEHYGYSAYSLNIEKLRDITPEKFASL
ncbi:MAG: hypothetical protein AAB037_06580, partial [Chloroflexota bacterium]